MLIDHGAKAGIEDKKGDTPLTLAERKGRSKVVALLLSGSRSRPRD
jgi:ankyrin repeat protein